MSLHNHESHLNAVCFTLHKPVGLTYTAYSHSIQAYLYCLHTGAYVLFSFIYFATGNY